jgi:tRNA 2-selenouridine synthase
LILEYLANHKGSAFGGYDKPNELTNEQFENLLAIELMKISDDKTIWIEDESRVIGNLSIPNKFLGYNERNHLYIFLEVSTEQRITNILKDYGNYPKEKLIESINKISKKLGGLETKKLH